jgi:hypothetical protein
VADELLGLPGGTRACLYRHGADVAVEDLADLVDKS